MPKSNYPFIYEPENQYEINAIPSSAGMVFAEVYPDADTAWAYLHSAYQAKPIMCSDSGEFLLKLCELFDELGYPMASVQYRTFAKVVNPARKKPPVLYHELDDYDFYEHERIFSKRELPNTSLGASKKKFIFGIHVMYRQHASLQGNVFWQRKRIAFRSGIELLHLIKSVIKEA